MKTVLFLLFCALSVQAQFQRTIAFKGASSTVPSGGGGGDITTGLIGWWKMDEGSGVNIGDSSVNNNGLNGTSPSWTTSLFGGACLQNTIPSINQRIHGSVSQASFTSSDFSISVWVSPTSLANSPVIVGHGIYQSYGYWLQINADGSVAINASPSGTVWTVTTSASAISTGSFQNIVVTRSGATVLIYVNGTPISTSTTGTVANPADSSAVELYVGDYNGDGFLFTGKFGDLRMYSRALAQADITELQTTQ